MKSNARLENGAVERNRTSTGKAHSALNAARLPVPPRPHWLEPALGRAAVPCSKPRLGEQARRQPSSRQECPFALLVRNR